MIVSINDRIVSIRNYMNVFLQRKPGRNKRPGFFMSAVALAEVDMLIFEIQKQRKVWDEIFISHVDYPVTVQLAG